MGKRLVMVGGGHAHMVTMTRIDEFVRHGHRVTLIGPSPYHYYSGMGPGLLSAMYAPHEIRFHVQKMAEQRGAAFVMDVVTEIDPKSRTVHLGRGDEIEYDVISFNIGSEVPSSLVVGSQNNVFPVKPIDNLLRARRMICSLLKQNHPNLVVVGGGPAGLEIAGNVHRLVQKEGGSATITVLAGRQFLSRFPEKVRRAAFESLEARGVQIVEGSYVDRLSRNRAVTNEGHEHPFDLAILAVGIRPPKLFQAAGLPTGSDGGLLVNAYLQSIEYREIFGGGDCISFQERPLDKVGVHAVRENSVLFFNLRAALSGERMKRFGPVQRYTLIFNLGDGKGILWRRHIVWHGKLFFLIKDYIDKRFMRRFQLSGERFEDQ